jgi:Flp pilus assembly pilin Flp
MITFITREMNIMRKIMEMKEFLNAFNKNQEGAVAVDFVVLTAAVVLIGVAATLLQSFFKV